VALPDLDPASIGALPVDVDVVFHCAGLAHRYPPNEPSEAEFRRVNEHGTRFLAERYREVASVFVLVSSIAALGAADGGPLRRSSVARPQSAYGRSKLAGEVAAANALADSGTALRIVRFPAIYGPGAPGAVGQLAAWVARGRPLPSCAGHVVRSIISMANAVDALAVIARSSALDGMWVAPTDAERLDVRAIAERIAAVLGRRLRVVPCPMVALRAMATLSRVVPVPGLPAASSLDRLLESCIIEDDAMATLAGWRAPHSCEEGLRSALAFTASEVAGES
jgi:UDP-glucose 4-epimerase